MQHNIKCIVRLTAMRYNRESKRRMVEGHWWWCTQERRRGREGKEKSMGLLHMQNREGEGNNRQMMPVFDDDDNCGERRAGRLAQCMPRDRGGERWQESGGGREQWVG